MRLLTGRRKFGSRLAQVGESLEVVEDWIARNVDDAFIVSRGDEFNEAGAKATRLVHRLGERLENLPTREVEADLLTCAKDLLLLKAVLAMAAGFDPDRSVLEAEQSRYPDLVEIILTDENTLFVKYGEAVNRSGHLYEKYPY